MAGKALICAAAVLLLSPVLIAADGDDGDDLTARQLADQAKDHLLDAKSVHLKLTDRSTDTRTSTTRPTSMDLALDQHGNCVGSMTMGSHGGSVDIVKQGAEVWMKPDADFWKAQVPGGEGDAVAELFKNRYIHGSTKDAMLKGMADTCDLTSFQKEVAGDDKASTLKKGTETTVDGTKVIPLKGVEDGKRAVLYVTSDTPHRLVKATQRGGGTDLTLTFTDYDKPVPTATPSADESVDVGKLQQELENA
ncbi:MAG: hypothetical protein HOV70_02240 [Streptomyces sp.]|nr:hypothetical protein [Streptomyces sp.]